MRSEGHGDGAFVSQRTLIVSRTLAWPALPKRRSTTAPGKTQAAFRVMDTGSTAGSALILCDSEGRIRALLSAGDSGPALELFDKEGELRAVLGTAESETTDGKKILWPESSLLLFGPDGKLRWSAR